MVRETIAIAGAERKMGSVITQKLARLNQYRLLLLSEEEDQLKDLPEILQSETSGLEWVHCLKEGCWEADIIILDTPISSNQEVAKKIKEVSTQKIVFVLSNDEQNAPASVSSDKDWQDLLPNAKLVIALNQLNSSGTILTGTDDESLNTIAEIIKKLGFEPIIKNKK